MVHRAWHVSYILFVLVIIFCGGLMNGCVRRRKVEIHFCDYLQTLWFICYAFCSVFCYVFCAFFITTFYCASYVLFF